MGKAPVPAKKDLSVTALWSSASGFGATARTERWVRLLLVGSGILAGAYAIFALASTWDALGQSFSAAVAMEVVAQVVGMYCSTVLPFSIALVFGSRSTADDARTVLKRWFHWAAGIGVSMVALSLPNPIGATISSRLLGTALVATPFLGAVWFGMHLRVGYLRMKQAASRK